MSERQPIMDLPMASTPYRSYEPRDPEVFDACTCHDPPGCSLHNSVEYLSRINLHQRLPSCSRTGLPVTYMDAGDPGGVPLLFMLPSGCTRWIGIQLEPLARRYGVRLIAVDRPGCGGTPWMGLGCRIDKSTDMVVSVLEHLHVRIKHIVVASGGIYYTLRLLTRHAESILCEDSEGNMFPRLYNIAPWSPVLTGDEAYFQPLNLIPTPLIKIQHQVIPTLFPALQYLGKVFEGSNMLIKDTRSRLPWSLGGISERQAQTTSAKCRETWESEHWEKGSWDFISTMINLENQGGIGQEHLICLNRGCNTGAEWFRNEMDRLEDAIRTVWVSNRSSTQSGLQVETWWGDEDGMVPKQGQEWLNKLFASKFDVLDLTVHHVKDGNHHDL
ncbi:hypothetical protein NCC49_000628 [Naganishia albida]|nr:hypothetical protein NCC49_000628 [Naganishia albida]